MTPVITWPRVDTILLDMDGTLLDLHYDNHFWLEHVPHIFAQRQGMSIDCAREELYARYGRIAGTMNWYCIDYWSRELSLDIFALKQELQHLIAVRPQVREFLGALREARKRVVLVTNAHRKSLDLKMGRTGLGSYFDAIICAHDFNCPKEDLAFWDHLGGAEPFTKETTLLVDDSLPVLESARTYGLAYAVAVRQPDSSRPPKDTADFPSVCHLSDLLPGLQA